MIDDGFLFWDCVENFINYFSWAGGSLNFKRNSAEISVEYLELEYFLSVGVMIGRIGFPLI